MHPNPAFRDEDRTRDLAFLRDRAFGILLTDGMLVSHVPFLMSDDGGHADLHLVRSNPICRAAPVAAKLVVTGPDGYVSPDWYGVDDQVPTWNYVAVHLTGQLTPLPSQSLEPLLVAQSAEYEARLPKAPWTLDKMSADAKSRMLRMILPFRFEITQMNSTWKLNQNKAAQARQAAAGQIETGLGSDLNVLSALMRDLTD